MVGTARVPLIRTKVRFVPKPRKSTEAVPLPGLLDVLSRPGTTCGKVLSNDSVLIVPVSENCSSPTLATGAFEEKSAFLILEPVT